MDNNDNFNKKEYPFWFGGFASCIATCVTHPLDLIKVRMQASKKRSTSLIAVIINILRHEGKKIFIYREIYDSFNRI